MTSLLANAPIVASGLFSSLSRGASNLKSKWDVVASFGGAIVIIVAVIFLVIAVVKSREKAKWYWSSGIAFVIGAILLMSGAVNTIQGNFSDTWGEVFGAINYVTPLLGFLGF
jgi:hypothetical protein